MELGSENYRTICSHNQISKTTRFAKYGIFVKPAFR